MNFFDKMYVGFTRNRYNSSETPRLLGYAVPYDSTKAGQKRIESVNRWKDKDLEGRILDNIPTRGFKLLHVVSRYSTSNKVFRVLDPRGFELEISADNLLDIALSGTISNGELSGEYVWAQHNSVYLISVNHDIYKLYLKEKSGKKIKQEKGCYYKHPSNISSVFRFEGIFHHTYLDYKFVIKQGKIVDGPASRTSFWNKPYEIHLEKYNVNVDICMNSGNKPSYLYTEFAVDSNGNLVKTLNVHSRKSPYKDLIPYQENTVELDQVQFNPLQWVNVLTQRYDSKKVMLNIQTDGVFHGFFETKNQATSFNYEHIIEKELCSIDISSIPRGRIDYTSISRNTSYNTPILTSPATTKSINIQDFRK